MAGDPGDAIFAAAASDLIPSGPGGVTRDRAVDLARQGVPPDQAINQAIQETATGKNPRDPHHSGDPQANAAAAASPSSPTGTTQGPQIVAGQGQVMTWLMASAKPTALVAGVPNWALLAGGLVGFRFLGGRH